MKNLIIVLCLILCGEAYAAMSDLSYMPDTGKYLFKLGDGYQKTQTLVDRKALDDAKTNFLFASVETSFLPNFSVAVSENVFTKDQDFFTNKDVNGFADPTLAVKYRAYNSDAFYSDVAFTFSPKFGDHKVAIKKSDDSNELRGAYDFNLGISLGKRINATELQGTIGADLTTKRFYAFGNKNLTIDPTTFEYITLLARHHFTNSVYGNLGFHYNLSQDWTLNTVNEDKIQWDKVYSFVIGAGYNFLKDFTVEANINLGKEDYTAQAKIEKSYTEGVLSLAYQF